MRLRRPFLSSLAVAFLSAAALAAPAVAEVPAVVVSIKPIHSLAAAVMKGLGEPGLLIDGASSPHSYSLKPSDARALSQADLVVWVDPAMESFLEKPLEALTGQGTVLRLSEIEGLTLLAPREGGVWDAHEHDHGEEAHHEEGHAAEEHDEEEHHEEEQAGEEHHHEEGELDAHLWLDPDNAARITATLARELGRLDPEHAAAYAANAEALTAELQALDGELQALLAPVRERPYIVFHDAYHYFERHYGLTAVGSVTVSPERAPGARRLSELRDKIEHLGAVCLFSEPQFEPALAETLTAGSEVRRGQLDPLGQSLPAGPGAYPALLRGLAQSLADCLNPAS